jgi:hypothetical protein
MIYTRVTCCIFNGFRQTGDSRTSLSPIPSRSVSASETLSSMLSNSSIPSQSFDLASFAFHAMVPFLVSPMLSRKPLLSSYITFYMYLVLSNQMFTHSLGNLLGAAYLSYIAQTCTGRRDLSQFISIHPCWTGHSGCRSPACLMGRATSRSCRRWPWTSTHACLPMKMCIPWIPSNLALCKLITGQQACMRIFAKALFSDVEIVLAAVCIQPPFAVPRLTSD